MGVRSSLITRTSHVIRFGGDFLMHRFRPEYNEVKAIEFSNRDSNDLARAREAIGHKINLRLACSMFHDLRWSTILASIIVSIYCVI